MHSKEIRNQFLKFFESKNHKILHSSPLFLEDDQSLLFVNAGMNPFKKIFLGQAPITFKRATNSQKCLRVSGKHNDLDEVGFDNYHHTLFEMLGSWSFNDYYKKEAIIWAWELVTEVFKLPKDKLYVTVYEKDQESYDLWEKLTDVDRDKILKFQEKDNFWEMGNVGPCGPCSEIHMDLGEGSCSLATQKGHICGVNNDCERYIEIWNIVFIAYNRLENGNLEELSSKYIDTGMGLERITRILQKKNSNYETDLFWPYIQFLESQSGLDYHKSDKDLQGAMCVIADHIRTLVFAIGDGILPSNTSRGYVLRRILRRAVRYGKKLGLKGSFLAPLSKMVIDQMKDVYPEIDLHHKLIFDTIQKEEERFSATLDKGLQLFEKEVAHMKSGETLKGQAAFVLYDTYGFPFDLTLLLCKEKGILVDEKEFNEYMDQQKELAKKNQQFKASEKQEEMMVVEETNEATEFLGYEHYEANDLKILQYRLLDDQKIELILDKTPFYAESGGQVSDKGILKGDQFTIEVEDVQKANDIFTHYGTITQGEFNPKSLLFGAINVERREALKRHHSGTHMLHEVVRQLFGPEAEFTSTYVNEDYYICEFLSEKLSQEQIKKVEETMNRMIQGCHPVTTTIENLEEAKKRGIAGRFDNKYKDVVRVVQLGDFSADFCGGTHVKNTGELGIYKLLSDTSAGTGVRRLESVAGLKAWEYLHNFYEGYREIGLTMRIPILDISSKIGGLLEENKALKKEIQDMKVKFRKKLTIDDIKTLETKDNISFLYAIIDDTDMPSLKRLAEQLETQKKDYIVCLLSEGENQNYVLGIAPSLLEKGLDIKKLNALLIQTLDAKGGGKELYTFGGYKAVINDKVIENLKNELLNEAIKIN